MRDPELAFQASCLQDGRMQYMEREHAKQMPETRFYFKYCLTQPQDIMAAICSQKFIL